MAISPYIRALRDRVGSQRLILPSVSAHMFDAEGRLLLVRQRDSGAWSTPGGVIELHESPADAVVRETWEETGLHVIPRRILAVYGGPGFLVQYPNGDESQYVIIAFECDVTAGELIGETDETDTARYVGEAEAADLSLSPWLRRILHAVYARTPSFEPPIWHPGSAQP